MLYFKQLEIVPKVEYMKNLGKTIIAIVILPSFIMAVLNCTCLCIGGIAQADVSDSLSQPASGEMDQSCSPFNNQSNKKCDCSQTLSAIKVEPLKNQVLISASGSFKAFLAAIISINGLSHVFYSSFLEHSPPQIAQRSTPLYILNRVLRI